MRLRLKLVKVLADLQALFEGEWADSLAITYAS